MNEDMRRVCVCLCVCVCVCVCVCSGEEGEISIINMGDADRWRSSVAPIAVGRVEINATVGVAVKSNVSVLTPVNSASANKRTR